MPKGETGIFARMRAAFGSFGAVPAFILVNGLVVGAISFMILLHEAVDQQDVEARALTGDMMRATEQSVSDMDEGVRALAQFYAMLEDSGAREDAPVTHSAQQILMDDIGIDGVIWATHKGAYRKKGSVAGLESGLPAFEDLHRETYGLSFNEIDYLRTIPWPRLRKPGAEPARQPVGIVVKVSLPGGDVGVLLALTTAEAIFDRGWAARRGDIARVTIRDHHTDTVTLDSVAEDADGALFLDPVPVSYLLQTGRRTWDIRFEVLPSPAARFLALSPWAALFTILLVTLLAVAISVRKNRQDRKFAEMAQTLKGAHHELQNKTSERDRLFHALRKSEREYKAVINSVSDVIFETDETGKIIFLNETWKRITDTDVSGHIGRSLFSVFPQEERFVQQQMFDELVRGERQAYRTETMLETGGGRPRAVEVAFSMLRMTEDKSLRVVGTITDIEKRRRAEQAMREAEQRYRAMFENAISGIYQTSPEGRFISANPALAEILGYDSPDDMILSVADIGRELYVNPQDREDFVQKLLFEGRVSGIESRVRRKDGEEIWIMENARVVRSPKGGILYYEGSIWDVTERKKAEELQAEARLQAEIASRSRMEFLANMSHELRTPLNAIIGFSEIIKDEIMGKIGTDVYKEYARDIYESGNYLLKVITEILEVSKFETGNRDLTESTFRLQKALKSCMTIMSARIEKAGVEVEMDLPDTLPEIFAEELGFKQIMLNLVGNAVKFSEQGGKVVVCARLAGDTGEMVIEVRDNGIGMSPEEIRKAMQPFGKVDNNFSTMKEGTGLGLTIVDSLVRLHGGRFELESEKGRGTTARVVLPARRVSRPSNVTPLKAAH